MRAYILASVLVHSMAWLETSAEENLVCQTGYVMDRFCINYGNLLDNSRFKTLEDPQEHSFHCLLDVGICVNSEFEILGDKPSGSKEHVRKFVLDAEGKEKLIKQSRDLGEKGYCSTCSHGAEDPKGKIGSKGVRTTVVGTTDGIAGAQGIPPTLKNVRVFHPTVSCTEALAQVEADSEPEDSKSDDPASDDDMKTPASTETGSTATAIAIEDPSSGNQTGTLGGESNGTSSGNQTETSGTGGESDLIVDESDAVRDDGTAETESIADESDAMRDEPPTTDDEDKAADTGAMMSSSIVIGNERSTYKAVNTGAQISSSTTTIAVANLLMMTAALQ